MPISQTVYDELADFVPGVIFIILFGVLLNEATNVEVPSLSSAWTVLVVVSGGYVAGRTVRAVSAGLEGFVERIHKPDYGYAKIYEEARTRTMPHIEDSDGGRIEGYARRLAYEESALYVRYSTLYRYNRNIVTVVSFYGFVLFLSPFVVGIREIYGFSAILVGVVLLLVALVLLYRTWVLYYRKKRALEDGFYMGLAKADG